jgi:altronate dehydratase
MGQNRPGGIERFVALVHTEGCGVAGVNDLHSPTLLGYLSHPSVHSALLIEHGCEITHNDFMRHQLAVRGLDPSRYGWASIQLDGGIDAVNKKISAWFAGQSHASAEPLAGEGIPLSLGLLTSGHPSSVAARTLGILTQAVVGAGGSIAIPQNSELLANGDFLERVLGDTLPTATLTYGQAIKTPGFHVMEAPTRHWVETATGLGATGIAALIGLVSDGAQQVHPLLPVVQVTSDQKTFGRFEADLDLLLVDDPNEGAEQLLQLALATLARRSFPRLSARGQEAFQLTRGLLGISM